MSRVPQQAVAMRLTIDGGLSGRVVAWLGGVVWLDPVDCVSACWEGVKKSGTCARGPILQCEDWAIDARRTLISHSKNKFLLL
jgi:hypothetical protein